MTRALGVVRLSELVDDTTSPERQREIITAKAGLRGSKIVGWAQDLDVSATKYPPTMRPDLARWLARPEDYDEIIFWRLDRFVRKPADLTDMIRWSEANGKGLVSATESFDLHDPLGEAMAYLASIFAKMESQATSVRVSGAHEYLRRMKRWGGGRPPYGYRVAKNPDGPGKVLVINEATAEYAREAVRRVISGESVNAVATDFNKRGIPPAQARVWGDSALRMILRDKALLGHVVYNGVSVLGDDGMPIIRAAPLIDDDEWARLQAALGALSQNHIRTDTPSMLLNVGQCGKCGGPLYLYSKHNTRTLASGEKKRYGPFAYYRCRNSYAVASRPKTCDAKLINVAQLDAAVDDAVMGYEEVEIAERRVIPGDDHSRQLAAVGQQIADLTTERYVRQIQRHNFDALMSQLQAEHARLSSLPSEPDTVEVAETGVFVGEMWPKLDVKGKRRLLLAMGWKVRAHRDDDGELIVNPEGGEYFADAAVLSGITVAEILEHLAAKVQQIAAATIQD